MPVLLEKLLKQLSSRLVDQSADYYKQAKEHLDQFKMFFDKLESSIHVCDFVVCL